MFLASLAAPYFDTRNTKRNHRRRPARRRPYDLPAHVEQLEPRRLLAAGILFDLDTGQIEIRGSGAREVAAVTRVDADIHILLSSGNQIYEDVFPRVSVRNVVFHGLAGNDRFDNATGVASQAYGGPGNDRLTGGSSGDQLFGDAGNDVVAGGGGVDLLRGGSGRDTLDGNGGADRLMGDSGNDRLEGHEGNDRLYGGTGDDLLLAGPGDDVAYGEQDEDTVRGGTGFDRLAGGTGDDVILGEEDRDILVGNSGRDLLIGGPGPDKLFGGSTGDLLIGSTTDYDANDRAVAAISRVWASDAEYADRIAHLSDSTLDFPLVAHRTVHDDAVRDYIKGSAGMDWFFLPGEVAGHGSDGQHDHPGDPGHEFDTAEFLRSLDELADVDPDETVESVVPHANNAVMRIEHFALFDLVSYQDVTHTAMATGDWTDPRTWRDGILPSDAARVLIPHDVEVMVDGQIEQRLRTIRVDGALEFAANRNTQLLVDTLIVDHNGVFRMGTPRQPISPNVTAELLITDSGPIDRGWDPFGLSRGAVIHGEATVYGAEKTGMLPLARAPGRGEEWLLLAETPVNWSVGDKLVLAGTHRTREQHEELEILQIDGALIRIPPLQFSHDVARDGLAVHVANLTRNARIVSENTGRDRGHLMFMHTRNVDLNYLGAYHLGRTNKLQPANDSVVDDDFELASGTGTNQRGRYAVHFHRNGVVDNGNPSRVHGSVVVDSRGWGYVNHSSFVEFTDNVAYDVDGASFVTEAGDEIGLFEGNFAVHSTGSGRGIESRRELQDFGHQGDGFWFQGGGVEVVGNVAAGQGGNGFVFFTRGLRQAGLGTTRFLSQNLVDESIANDRFTISVGEVPLRGFRDNVAYSSSTGAATRFHKLGNSHEQQSIIEDLKLWNNERGLHIPYTNRVTIRDVEIIGSVRRPSGTGIDRNSVTRNITYENVIVEGFRYGVRIPERGENVLVSGRLNNTQNVVIETPVRDNRVVRIMDGVVMETTRGLGPELNIRMKAEIEPREESFEHLFYRDTVSWSLPEGPVQIFFIEQATDFVPFPERGPSIPREYVGKTNQELWDQFGKAIGGQIAPDNAKTLPGVEGLVAPIGS